MIDYSRCSVLIPTYDRPYSLNLVLASLLPHKHFISDIWIGCARSGETCVDEYTPTLIKALRLAGVQVTLVEYQGALIDTKLRLGKMCKSEITLLLDDDVIPGSRYFALMSYFHSQDVGMISGTVQSPFNPQGYTDWSDKPITHNVTDEHCNTFHIKDGQWAWENKLQVYMLASPGVFKCDYLVGGALFVQTSLIQCFDTLLTHYDKDDNPVNTGEEIDFSLTLREKNYLLIYDSAAVCWHLYWPNGGERVWDRTVAIQNWKYIAKKHGLPHITSSPKVLRNVVE